MDEAVGAEGPVRTLWRVLRTEGARAVGDRLADRWQDGRRRRSYREGSDLPLAGGRADVPVLNVLSTAPLPRLGGLQAQLVARLEHESRTRPVALLSPRAGGWRLEVSAEGRRAALDLPAGASPSPPSPIALADPGFEAAVAHAAALVGARWLHVEGLAAMPLASLLALQQRENGGAGLRLLLSVHDFGLFCPRPHLLEVPAHAFCGYSRDLARCARCLGETWPVADGFQAERRALAGRLLAAADSVTFPSRFLLQTHRELFPGLPAAVYGRQRVIEPELEPELDPAESPGRRPRLTDGPLPARRPASPPRHVAFVGNVLPHKGALVFAELVERLRGEVPAVRWSVYGGGEAALLRRLGAVQGVRVRGYYRAGSLPGLLRRDRVDLALLLSVVPESYSLTLSECRAAGVPVLAFDHGAIADRVREQGGGLLVDPAAGAAGMANVLAGVLSGAVELPGGAVAPAPDPPARAAEAFAALYRALGILI